MVNSPSQSCSRPVAPPPLGGPVRPPFPLPPSASPAAPGAASPVPTRPPKTGTQNPLCPSNQTKSNHPASRPGPLFCDFRGSPRSPEPGIRARCRPNQGRTPSNQGSSCLIKATPKFPMAPGIHSRIPPSVSIRAYLRSHTPAFPISEIRHPSFFRQSRQKTPVIVPHQGISRHPPKNTRPLGAWWFSGAWRLEFGASPRHPLCDFASKTQQSRLIVPHQGKRLKFVPSSTSLP